MSNEKMIWGANVLDKIVKIAGGFACAMIWVFAIFAVLVIVVGEGMYMPDGVFLDFEFIRLHLAQEYQTITPMFRVYTAAILAMGAVYAAALMILSRMIRAILAPMKEGRPFESSVCASLKKIAYWVFAVGGISQVMQMISSALMMRAYPIDAVFSSSAVTQIEYSFSIDLSFLLAGFVVLFLSWVFAYGQTLQQEADETL